MWKVIMEENLACFELRDSGNFLRVELIKYNYSNAQLDWDNNWISSKISIKSGAFSGQFNADLMAVDFKKFANELESLYDKLDGIASFNTLEDHIEIKITGDGFGHFVAKCIATDNVNIGNKLFFKIEFDQTIIPEMIAQLETINNKFPVIGDIFNE